MTSYQVGMALFAAVVLCTIGIFIIGTFVYRWDEARKMEEEFDKMRSYMDNPDVTD